MFDFWFQCSQCRRRYLVSPEHMLCDDCGAFNPDEPLKGVLDVRFSLKAGQPRPDRDLDPLDTQPVPRHFYPDLHVGSTPLWRPERLKQEARTHRLFIKDDTRNPTGSLKDRASFLVAAFARMHGIHEIVAASTGNAGSSMAGIGAAAGLEVTLFLPKTVPLPKIIQALQYGARPILVDGNYNRAYSLSLEWSECRGSLNRNTAFNPLTIEGKKSVSFEIWQQLGRLPDAVFVPTGDGAILAGVYKGFQDLCQLGLTPSVPRIFAVTAEGCPAFVHAMKTGKFTYKPGETLADSIAVEVPQNGYRALAYLKRYRGEVVPVPDEAMLEAQQRLAALAGLFVEPSSAAAYAGYLQVRQELDARSTVVILATGNGLKDVENAKKRLSFPRTAINQLADLDMAFSPMPVGSET